MNTQDDYQRLETIEQYFNGSLSVDEMANFENALKNDFDFSKEVSDYQKLTNMIKEITIEQNIIATLDKLEQEEPITPLKKKASFLTLFPYLSGLVAACLIFVLYASFSVIQLPGSENDLTIVRDVDVSILSPVEKKVFDNFYAGQSYLAEGQFQKAVQSFQVVLKNNNLRPYFKEATQWHLVLAYLKSGQIQEANHLYDELSSCNDCVYPIGKIDKAKLWWQIFWAKVF
ncbi:tetratricopeptide (TPR) repeat protein [Arcicella rosea]|uniref:tetratricopeptide repeat protein n=1 Tax=Arcicella rosea TaxID=502909 RepID=UPI00345D1A72